jgi:hypothetical protein
MSDQKLLVKSTPGCDYAATGLYCIQARLIMCVATGLYCVWSKP